MFDQAKSVIATALAIAATLLVFYVIGVAFGHTDGWPAVGSGIHQTLTAAHAIIKGL